MADTRKRRARRQFTDEFKAGVVRLVLDDGKTVGAVARDMGLTETAVREWVKHARADRTHGRAPLIRSLLVNVSIVWTPVSPSEPTLDDGGSTRSGVFSTGFIVPTVESH